MVVIINGHDNHDMTKRKEIVMIGIISDIDSVYVHQEVSPMATVLVQNWCALKNREIAPKNSQK